MDIGSEKELEWYFTILILVLIETGHYMPGKYGTEFASCLQASWSYRVGIVYVHIQDTPRPS
jgi:hypothetical protein